MSENKRKRRTPTAEGMRLRMADLCMRSEQCESDIKSKLIKAQLSPEEVKSILEFLLKERFIDNKRFARAFVRDKVRFAGWGRYKIRLHLAAKHIDSGVIAESLREIDEEEYEESLKRVALNKSRGLDLNTREGNVKLYRFLLTRGFESGLAVKIIKELRSKSEHSVG